MMGGRWRRLGQRKTRLEVRRSWMIRRLVGRKAERCCSLAPRTRMLEERQSWKEERCCSLVPRTKMPGERRC